MSDVFKQRCVRCGVSMERALLYALMNSAGATLSWNPAECYNPETDQMEEHDLVSYEEYAALAEEGE